MSVQILNQQKKVNWSYADKRHMKFVVSLSLNAAQGSQRTVPLQRLREHCKGAHAVAFSGFGNYHMR